MTNLFNGFLYFYDLTLLLQPELEFQTFDSSETEGVPAPDFGDVEMNDVSGDSNGDKSDKPKVCMMLTLLLVVGSLLIIYHVESSR